MIYVSLASYWSILCHVISVWFLIGQSPDAILESWVFAQMLSRVYNKLQKNTILKDLQLGAIGFYGYFIPNSGVGQYPILQTLKWLFIS